MSEVSNAAKKPALVVPFSIIFGSISLNGESIISEEVYDIIVELRRKGYYIIVDCCDDIVQSSVLLTSAKIPFDGLTYDKDKGQVHDEERYATRIDYHYGWDNIGVVIDEDLLRLKIASELGASAIQVQSGCVISQRAKGYKRVDSIVPKFAYQASAMSGV